MSTKIKCPNCGNSEFFYEDTLGLDLIDEWRWDGEKYQHMERTYLDQDESRLRCGECNWLLDKEYDDFLEGLQ